MKTALFRVLPEESLPEVTWMAAVRTLAAARRPLRRESRAVYPYKGAFKVWSTRVSAETPTAACLLVTR